MRRALIRSTSRPRLPTYALQHAPPSHALLAANKQQVRRFFGIGEVLGVITNPGEVLRSLSESKKLLEEARQEMKDNAEREQIPPIHSFSPLPGFWERPNEIRAIERALGGVPAFTVAFGASSVGKTALLRQVLSSDKYHVLHFDLRIAGFADLPSLYFSLARQMESYFAALPDLMGKEWGWGEFEKESWAFKHDRIGIEKRIESGGEVKTSDLARLMELFQSALLKYWEFESLSDSQRKKREEAAKEAAEGRVEGKKDVPKRNAPTNSTPAIGSSVEPTEEKMREGWGAPAVDLKSARTVAFDPVESAGDQESSEEDTEPTPPPKRIPVFFLDEAHKLPALIENPTAMKSLLDAMLVLTKQDRLCHCLHATSDAFYMHWLRQLNIMQHCNILSLGDPNRTEAKKYFEEHLLPHIPAEISHKISFEGVYEVFGGKMAHLADYTAEFVNSSGKIAPFQSSHFLQAHSLLNLHLIHSTPSPAGDAAQGFEIYSPIKQGSPTASPSPYEEAPPEGAPFSNLDLLHVMGLLQLGPEGQSSPSEASYFRLCRQFGARAIDGMVKAKLLELRWSRTVTEEGDSSAYTERRKEANVGPVVVPTTAVVRYAMGVVLKEYEDLKLSAESHRAKEEETKA